MINMPKLPQLAKTIDQGFLLLDGPVITNCRKWVIRQPTSKQASKQFLDLLHVASKKVGAPVGESWACLCGTYAPEHEEVHLDFDSLIPGNWDSQRWDLFDPDAVLKVEFSVIDEEDKFQIALWKVWYQPLGGGIPVVFDADVLLPFVNAGLEVYIDTSTPTGTAVVTDEGCVVAIIATLTGDDLVDSPVAEFPDPSHQGSMGV